MLAEQAPPPPHIVVVQQATADAGWGVDVIRLALLVGGMFLILTTIKIAYLRAKSPPDSARRQQSPWQLLSYALFALVPVVGTLGHFAEPLSWRYLLYGLAIITGLIATFSDVTIVLWTRTPVPPPGPHLTTEDDDVSVGGRDE